jgi:hypothetical protein
MLLELCRATGFCNETKQISLTPQKSRCGKLAFRRQNKSDRWMTPISNQAKEVTKPFVTEGQYGRRKCDVKCRHR